MTAPTHKPVTVWDVRPWGTPALRVADVNGDGKAEVLFLQSAGAHANEDFDPRVSTSQSYKTGTEDQDLFCLTLTAADGQILWQHGEPWSLERPYSWNGNWERFCEISDINGDGIPEILLLHRGELRIYGGADGRLMQSRRMPNSGFYSLDIVKTRPGDQRQIFTKSVTSSLTHSCGNPSLLLTHDLELIWQLDEIPGAGHMAGPADLDGDGFDEFVIGFGLFDHDGTLLWQHQPLSANDHLDSAVVEDLTGNGDWTIALAHDGHQATVHNVDGSERFQVRMEHCQTIQSAAFFADAPGRQLLFNDKAEGSGQREAAIVDHHGRERARYAAPGYSTVVPWPTALGRESVVAMIRPPGVDDRHGACWMDPKGRILADLDVRHSFGRHIRQAALAEVPPQHWCYYGAGQVVLAGDLDSDGQHEVLVTDRETVWIFRQP